MTQVKDLVDAYDAFITGCKADGTWSAIKAGCIMAGWDNLNGALTPLVGTAPTNNNFVSGDYSRKTGLVGDGSTKYLDSNRAENADPRNSHHMSFYVTAVATSGNFPMIGESSYAASTSLTGIYFYRAATPYQYNLRSRNIGGSSERLGDANTKFVAINRSSSTQFTARADTSTATFNVASVTPKSDTYYIYSRNAGAINNPGNQRMAFYSIGESLDLALLDSRVTQLMTGIASALPLDVDAAAYISAVEAADGQSLEPGVKLAIDRFVVGCKDDGIWSAIKASCILAGARTLAGALVPLAGTAPTNNNFVSGDYDRKTGLIGNGSSKHLNTNRADNADPQDDAHVSVYVSTPGSKTGSNNEAYIGASNNVNSYRELLRVPASNGTFAYVRTGGGASGGTLNAVGFLGASRSNSTSFVYRREGTSVTINKTSFGPSSNTVGVFAERHTSVISYTTARLSFYSLGQSLDLAMLDGRVTALMAAIDAAIPS